MLADDARVLVVHDYLTQRGGGERVALAILRAFPGARMLTSIYDPAGTFPEFAEHDVRTLWVDRVPAFRSDPRRAFPVLARAYSRADAGDADVVVCSSSGWAHGLPTRVPKVVYCHTPARWLYESDDYLPGVPAAVRPAARLALPLLEAWDKRAAAGVTTYLANGSLVRERIRRAYGRDAQLLFPPVSIDPAGEQEPVPGLEPGYLLVVSRPRSYKHVDVVCEAVEQSPGERLVVVGGLPERSGGRAWSSALTGLSGLTDGQMRWLYAHAKALVGVSHEDFGLTPIEAYSFGTPALLLRAGGYLDSSVEDLTCVFVDALEVGQVRDAIARLGRRSFDPAAVRRHAARFSEACFVDGIRSAVEGALEQRAAARTA